VEFTPFLKLKESYSNNVNQQRGGGQEGFITQVIPGFDISSVGSRVKVDVNYALQYRKFSKTERKNEPVSHRVRADTSINLVRNELILDAGVQRSQGNIVANTRLPFANTINPTDITTTKIGPKYQRRFGSAGRLLLSYSNTYIQYDGDEVDTSNARTQTYKANLEDNFKGSNVSWELGYFKLDNSEDDNAVGREKKYLELSFLVGNRIVLFYQAGDEGAFYWLGGVKWSPNKRNTLEASYGRRFFGETKEFSFLHRNKKISLKIVYTERVVDQSSRNDSVFSGIVPSTITSGTFVQKKARAVLALTGKKLNLAVGLINKERIIEQLQAPDKTRGGVLRIGWKIAKNMDLVLDNRYQKNFFPDGIRVDEFVNSTLLLKQRMGKKAALSYELRQTQHDSNLSDRNYRETAVSVIFNIKF